MEGINPALPMWAQIVATLVPIIGAAWALMRGYDKGKAEPAPQTASVLMGIGGALSDRFATQDLIEAVRSIGNGVEALSDEIRKLRKSIDHTADLVIEANRSRRAKPEGE